MKGKKAPTKKSLPKEERFLTKHPLGKSGKNISKEKYDAVKQAIVSALKTKELTHTELFEQLNEVLRGKVGGNISWYAQTVKLDLEARNIVHRTASKPQRYRVKETPKIKVYTLPF